MVRVVHEDEPSTDTLKMENQELKEKVKKKVPIKSTDIIGVL